MICKTCGHTTPHNVQRGECGHNGCDCDAPVWVVAGGPDDGHTFRIVYESRGSYAVVGEEHHTDARDFDGIRHVVEVRAWSLRDALLKAADLPFHVLMGTEVTSDERAGERARIVWWLRQGIHGPAAITTSDCCRATLAELADVIEQHPDRFAQAPTGEHQ